MKKYKFRLDSILKYKYTVEQKEKEEFSRTLKEYNEHKGVIRKLENRLKQQRQAFFRHNTSINAQQLKLMFKWENYMLQKIQEYQEKLIKTEELLHTRKNKMIKAIKDRKVLDNLKTKSLINYKKELLKQNQAAADDKASYTYYLDNRKE